MTDDEATRRANNPQQGLGQRLAGMAFLANALAKRLESAGAELAQDARRLEDLLLLSAHEVEALAEDPAILGQDQVAGVH